MLYIDKNSTEPRLLVTERSQVGITSYNDLSTDAKNATRRSLLEEQGYLCAYCMKRISIENTSIEHYDPQSSNNGTDMLYRNMLGVCDGGQNNSGSGQNRLTCDKQRGNRRLTVDPLDKNTIDQIKYRKNGVIYSENSDIDTDLNHTLNLNGFETYLIANRRAVYDTLVSEIEKNGGKSEAFLLKLKKKYESKDSEGKRIPFSGIALYYINKWLKSCA